MTVMPKIGGAGTTCRKILESLFETGRVEKSRVFVCLIWKRVQWWFHSRSCSRFVVVSAALPEELCLCGMSVFVASREVRRNAMSGEEAITYEAQDSESAERGGAGGRESQSPAQVRQQTAFLQAGVPERKSR